jgi:hypothetical protein
MPITEIPAAQVFKTFVEDFGMTKDGRATRSPWTRDQLPAEIMDSPVEWYIYNVGPIKQIINAGSMGQYHLLPPAEGKSFSEPLKIKKYMIDWADQGDYKQKPVVMDGWFVAREWVTPNGERETDLRPWGVFASKHNPPSEEDLKAAAALLHKKMDDLVKHADALYTDEKRRREITDIYKIAARHLLVERPWCTVSKAMASCPGCFRPVEQAAAKCIACGSILDWNKARKLRLVTKEEFAEAVADGLVAAPISPMRIPDAKGK